MYVPKKFAVSDLPTLQEIITTHPFATLVTHSESGLTANHLPFLFSPTPEPYGSLSAHVARANPCWKDLSSNEVLVIFQSHNGYISPSWYPSKHEDGKAVPTWNYSVVHAHGTLRVINDSEWLKRHLDQASAIHEAKFPHPWKLADAPAEYIEKMLTAIVGIEITITKLVGKNKLSQNQSAQNQQGVIAGLREQNCSTAQAMAHLIDKFNHG